MLEDHQDAVVWGWLSSKWGKAQGAEGTENLACELKPPGGITVTWVESVKEAA